jgi:hypothetical protein
MARLAEPDHIQSVCFIIAPMMVRLERSNISTAPFTMILSVDTTGAQGTLDRLMRPMFIPIAELPYTLSAHFTFYGRGHPACLKHKHNATVKGVSQVTFNRPSLFCLTTAPRFSILHRDGYRRR